MSLSLIAGVAKLAFDLGPSVVRGVSSLFGGNETAEKVADAVEKADQLLGASKEEKLSAVNHELQKLPPDALVDLHKIKLELEKENTRRMELQLQDSQAEHHETQQTIRLGDQAEDEYVRRTRPYGCRLGLYAAIAYIFTFEWLHAYCNKGSGADWQIAFGLMLPFLTYLGWRTADKFGKTKGTGSIAGDALATLKTFSK